MIGNFRDWWDEYGEYHLKKVFAVSELKGGAVIRNFRITAVDGKSYNTKHYNLAASLSKRELRM